MCGIEFSNSAESLAFYSLIYNFFFNNKQFILKRVRPSLRINDQLNENFNSTNRKAKHAKNSK
jgi:hypothetical protein